MWQCEEQEHVEVETQAFDKDLFIKVFRVECGLLNLNAEKLTKTLVRACDTTLLYIILL